MDDTLKKLLTRYLHADMTIEEELALFSLQPTGKQQTVERRLRVLDRYLAMPENTSDDAAAAGLELGIGKRQFYSLVTRLRQLGPTRGLTPGFRNSARPAPSRDGLAEPIDNFLRRVLADRPAIRITEVEHLIKAECDRLGVSPPGPSTVRRRVHALRRSASARPKGPLGAKIVIDQVAIEMPVKLFDRTTLSVITMIIDENSQAILGHSLMAKGDGIGLGLVQALNDFKRRSVHVEIGGYRVTSRMAHLTWVVPPGLEEIGVSMVEEGSRFPGAPRITGLASGPRRHGDFILRFLGDRLGHYPFRKLADLREDFPLSRLPGLSFEDAVHLVAYEVDQWNARVFGLTGKGQGHSSAGRKLARIAETLGLLFQPVMREIEERFVRPLPHEWQPN